MFYSHELLTNRQYGVATIWLVATLGSKSNLKKVTRKAILDVDVPKACDKITDTDAPLALRLQGSLLYGVSRVYSQQCMYVLADTQSFRDKMRGVEQIMGELEIDPDIGKMRPEQLNLPDDPAFFPDLDMGLDLAAFGISSDTDTTRASSVLSRSSPASSRTSLGLEAGQEEEPGIELPSLDTPRDFAGFDFPLGAATSSGMKTGSRVGAVDVFEESAIVEDPGFMIDDDGSIVATTTDQARQSALPSATGEGRAVSESGTSARVRAEHEAGGFEDQPLPGFDDEGMIFGPDDEQPPAPAEPFSSVDPEDQQPAVHQPGSSVQPSHESTTTTTAEAPQRRIRQPKQLQVDERAELSNRQLGEWSTNYLANMNALSRMKEQNKSTAQAKKNAAFWILDQGIGGIEVNFGDDHFDHPLSVFSGQNLLDALTHRHTSPTRSKRARSESVDLDEEEDGRRVRPRGEDEEEVARGEEGTAAGFEEDGIMYQADDHQIESEVGRQAPSSLRDPSSAMPWNLSSRAGSPRLGSAAPGMSSSVGGAGGLPVGPPSVLSRRRSRLTSASPLHSKAPRLPSLAIEDDPTGAFEEGMLPGGDYPGLEGEMIVDDDFELYGPSAAVDTQTAAQSQWLKNTLENEAYNFLNFLETQIGERGMEVEDEDGQTITSITLDELLQPANNTKVVGAQAMLHVLALTTKGLILVEQKEAFGDIVMRVVPRRGEQAEEHDGGEGMVVE